MRSLTIFIAFFGCFAVLRAQSFNVDLDTASPPVGGGVPSSMFGGVANQPGRWNSVSVAGDADWLYDLDGNAKNIAIRVNSPAGGTTGGGFNNSSNTGDFALLLNDASRINFPWASWTFEGLSNGTYIVMTYTVRPSGSFGRSSVSVSNSVSPDPQIVQGTMPGNQFVLGITHSTHTALVLDGTLSIVVSRQPNDPNIDVNGFQITAVPEPSTIALVAVGFALTRIRKRKSS